MLTTSSCKLRTLAWDTGRITAVKTKNQWERTSRTFKLHVALIYQKSASLPPQHYLHTIDDVAEADIYIRLLRERSLHYLHSSIVANPDFWDQNSLLLPEFQHADASAHHDLRVCSAVLAVDGMLLEHCSSFIRNEKQFVEIAAANTLKSLRFMSIKLSNDAEFIKGLVQTRGHEVLAHCGTLFYNDANYATYLRDQAARSDEPLPGGEPLQYFSPMVLALLSRLPDPAATDINAQRENRRTLRERLRPQTLRQRAEANARGRGNRRGD